MTVAELILALQRCDPEARVDVFTETDDHEAEIVEATAVQAGNGWVIVS